MKYSQYDKEDLMKFATDRGIPMPYISKLRTHSSVRGIVRALEEADRDRTFRLLDLPPELRNMVYRELLVIDKPTFWDLAPKCHPQILRTSKAVHQEAAGILTGDNVIVVRICPSRVFVHGIECGTYAPQNDSKTQKPEQKALKNLIWPDLLRKARMIRVVVALTYSIPTGSLALALPNCGTIHNILFSLCAFLQQDVSLRSFDLYLSSIATAYLILHETEKLQEQIRLTLYPLRLLRDAVVPRVEGIDFLSFSQPPDPSSIAVQTAERIVSGSVLTATRQFQAMIRVHAILVILEKVLASGNQPLGPPTEGLRLIGDIASMAMASSAFLVHGGSSTKLTHELSHGLELVRDYCDRISIERAPEEIKKQVDGMLMLGVELKRAEGRVVVE